MLGAHCNAIMPPSKMDDLCAPYDWSELPSHRGSSRHDEGCSRMSCASILMVDDEDNFMVCVLALFSCHSPCL